MAPPVSLAVEDIENLDWNNHIAVKRLMLCFLHENIELRRMHAETQERLEEALRRLVFYENPHTPPSQQKLKRQDVKKPGKRRGAPLGHGGVSRLLKEPDEVRLVKASECEACGSTDLKLIRWKEKTIEDLPEIPPSTATKFVREMVECNNCGHVFTAKDAECPVVGKFGVNLMVLILMLKFLPRSVLRKTVDLLEHMYHIRITANTANSVLERVAGGLQAEYNTLLKSVQRAKVVYVDETSLSVLGKNWWIWIFRTKDNIAVVIRNSRGFCVPKEILGEDFSKVLVRDGWRAYDALQHAPIQRCWAHLLREAKEFNSIIAGRHLYERLCQMFADIKVFNASDPSDEVRKEKYVEFTTRMNALLAYYGKNKQLKKIITYARNGGSNWFTCVLIEGVEPTNNLAEQAIREHVMMRKIIGALRSTQGAKTYETLASLIATWKLNNMNIANTLKQIITQNLCLT